MKEKEVFYWFPNEAHSIKYTVRSKFRIYSWKTGSTLLTLTGRSW
jgi:hypothetical protein